MSTQRSTTQTTAPPPTSDGASLRSMAEADGVRFILATFTTLTGKPCSKLMPVEAADELQYDGAGFAGFAAGAMGQQPRDPDLVAIPDLRSYTCLNFLRPGLAMVHCDPHVGGLPHPFAPRVILRRALEKAAAKGFDLMSGAEIEYFLLRRRPDGSLVTADEQDTAPQPCYDSRGVTRMYEHLTAVSDAMNGLGWGPYASDHEDGNGQFEQNFTYADAMVTADRVITLRYLLQMMADQRGMIASFMPKPFTDRTGSGMHVHLSLWREGAELFPARGTDGSEEEKGLGLDPIGYQFIGGLLEHAPALHALANPTVNSYKRTGATTTASGATWAPRFATYGGNDRTHLVRVPDGHRVEFRGADGAANPYLATAGVLAAGLDGIERRLDPGEPGAEAKSGRALPRTLIEAVAEFQADECLREALDGDPGSGVAQYYLELKRQEFYDWHSQVSAWEVERYLV